MKKTFWIIIALVIILLGFWLWESTTSTTSYTADQNNQATSTTPNNNVTFTSADRSIIFSYPTILTVTQKNNIITLHHEINFSNHPACDFKGDAGISPTLTDFNVTMRTFNVNIALSAQTFDPSLATSSENIDGTLDLSPGAIDPFNTGEFNGYMVTEGVEGCGYVTYYLPISNSRTLVIQKEMLGAFSSVADPSQMAKILATSGVISPDQSNSLFNAIIQSLQVR